MTATPVDLLALGWADHLRQGGVTSWAEWSQAPHQLSPGLQDHDSPCATSGGQVAGAPNLEFLRLLNTIDPNLRLAAEILERALPGRGASDLDLPGQPSLGPRFVAAPAREIARVGAGVVADLALRARARAAQRPGSSPRRGVPYVELVGAPTTVALLRARLTKAGFRTAPRAPKHVLQRIARPDEPALTVIVVEPLIAALADVWSARVQAGSGRRWGGFIARRINGAAPASLAYVDAIAHYAQQLGPHQVHVVTADGLFDQLEDVLGHRPAIGPAPLPAGVPVRLMPAAVDALRRVNTVLAFHASPEHPDVVAARWQVTAALQQTQVGPPELGVEPAHEEWAESASYLQARSVADEAKRRGVHVHGDLEATGVWQPQNAPALNLDDVVAALAQVTALMAHLPTATPGSARKIRA